MAEKIRRTFAELAAWVVREQNEGNRVCLIADIDWLAQSATRESWKPEPLRGVSEISSRLRDIDVELIVVTGRPLETAARFVDDSTTVYASEGHETRINGRVINPDAADRVRRVTDSIDRVVDQANNIIVDWGYEPVECNSRYESDVLCLRHTGGVQYAFSPQQGYVLVPRFEELAKQLKADSRLRFRVVQQYGIFAVEGDMPPSPAQDVAKAQIAADILDFYDSAIYAVARPDDATAAHKVLDHGGRVAVVTGGTFSFNVSLANFPGSFGIGSSEVGMFSRHFTAAVTHYGAGLSAQNAQKPRSSTASDVESPYL